MSKFFLIEILKRIVKEFQEYLKNKKYPRAHEKKKVYILTKYKEKVS